MNKRRVIEKVIEQLESDVALYRRAARSAFEEATDEQNKAENKYDTRGLEASYLARGQARQVAETEDALAQFRSMDWPAFEAGMPISAGALVELERGREREWYLLAPWAGGKEIQHGKNEILVITPQSPLGRELVGKKQGDSLVLRLGGAAQKQRIVSVC